MPRVIHQPVTMRHLITMTDDRGIFEHAKGAQPRYSHGYCTDDNARLLVVAARDEGRTFASRSLARIALQFLLDAQCEDGTVRNRMSIERIWMDESCTQDCWGRALWAFGTSASRDHHNVLRAKSLEGFDRSIAQRSTSLRATAFAALGAAEVLGADRTHAAAREFLRDARAVLTSQTPPTGWLWPEPRLTYANACIPDAIIAVGDALDDEEVTRYGLDLLTWLVAHESHNGHLSVTPVGGRGPGDPKPAFDQQPIEVAAIADAAVRAYHLTGESRWRHTLELAVGWFLGQNDSGEMMIDPETEGGFDGLHADGVNFNQGAESTLAMISTMQHAGGNGILH